MNTLKNYLTLFIIVMLYIAAGISLFDPKSNLGNTVIYVTLAHLYLLRLIDECNDEVES